MQRLLVPSPSPCCAMGWEGGEQEGLLAPLLRLDKTSHHRDSSADGLMSTPCRSHHSPQAVEAVETNQKCFTPYIPMLYSQHCGGDSMPDKRSSPHSLRCHQHLSVQLPNSSRSVLAPQLTLTMFLTHVFLPSSQVPRLPQPAWPGKDILHSAHVIQLEGGHG